LWVNGLESDHALGTLFYPFTRAVGGMGYNPRVTERVIAPVPGKAEGLRAEFVTSVRTRALDLLWLHPTMVSIGYSFTESDRDSYAELLDALSTHRTSPGGPSSYPRRRRSRAGSRRSIRRSNRSPRR